MSVILLIDIIFYSIWHYLYLAELAYDTSESIAIVTVQAFYTVLRCKFIQQKLSLTTVHLKFQTHTYKHIQPHIHTRGDTDFYINKCITQSVTWSPMSNPVELYSFENKHIRIFCPVAIGLCYAQRHSNNNGRNNWKENTENNLTCTVHSTRNWRHIKWLRYYPKFSIRWTNNMQEHNRNSCHLHATNKIELWTTCRNLRKSVETILYFFVFFMSSKFSNYRYCHNFWTTATIIRIISIKRILLRTIQYSFLIRDAAKG